MADSDLRIAYETHDGVRKLIDCLVHSLEGISLDFDRWDEQYVTDAVRRRPVTPVRVPHRSRSP